jgi:enamine deaminase RidA (YjgF/YER057c/UK114 family)
MTRRYLNPHTLPNWSGSFSQVVIVPPGPSRTVCISGQVAVDPDHDVIGVGDLAAQAEHAFANLSAALAAADAAPADVVRLGIYIVNYRPEQASIIQQALRKVFASDDLPASTWLGVQSLALPDLLIEVEATAIVAVPAGG